MATHDDLPGSLQGREGRVGRSASVAALGDGKHSAQAATVLLPMLRVGCLASSCGDRPSGSHTTLSMPTTLAAAPVLSPFRIDLKGGCLGRIASRG